ncbi:hypothetical protein HanRHA438_Chr02g0091291 [Helianthus annuus]|uniref:Uncharacterized protein n=1 Tax=Helianthus annuus TaxID=4232 RepID=A0A9K3JRG3_HELAN|nr:hypothetical protein HanXRQr2_Chr02g0079981 [Helianthus annuus]KAJ0605794.1 hypothetical protein HanHA300_Chr02g0066961 [Helianthus annuus]KAJ0619794.1 hypothetical protein HanHA89_Chr02g0075261 [Helianthus annuus]KAJ0778253.1 hypothetical protein HanLR1_Chr02g0069661 [Helianthus annuus]KAJ0787235.1 hypothetical protein HanOQP8_Chr02g0080241 [Helianthus annuus]
MVSDLSMADYITATASKHPICMPHTASKKLMAVHIVKHAMEIIHLLTGTVLHLYSCFCYNTFVVCHVKQEFLLTDQMGL